MFVLDASVTLSWAFKDEFSTYAAAVEKVIGEDHPALVPALWLYEVSNGILFGEQKKRITQAHAALFLESLLDDDIQIDYSRAHTIFHDTLNLARQYRLTIYDASYLELAMRNNLPLATLDDALRKAAKASGISLFEPAH